MLYLLADWSSHFGPLRLFDYVTFRAAGAFLTAFLLVALAIPPLLPFFRKHCVQKSARTDDAPQQKPTTPLMGGVIIIAGIIISTLFWGKLPERTLFVFIIATLGLMALGMVDDIIKTRYLRSEKDGVKERTKLIIQAIVAVFAIYALYKTHGAITMQVHCPFSRQPFQFLPGAENIAVWVPFMKEPLCYLPLPLMPLCLIIMLGFNYAVLAGTSNGVNLTDGKDGLAAGCMVFAAMAFAAVAYLHSHKIFADYLNIPYVPQAGEVGVYACAIAGACLGFLWHNCAPAPIYMGDTGSLALGGALSLVAIMLGQQLLLLIIGFIFVVESLSVLLQRLSYRYRNGKRIFLMAPIHHHYEKKGVPDPKLTIRFWIVAGLCALIALATLKMR